MGILRFIEKVCKQPVVYWGTPVSDGYGKFTFATPVELTCRWEDKSTIISDDTGQQQTCDASILVTQDLDLHGYLYLGTLASLSVAQKANPMTVNLAREIVGFDKIPLLFSTTKFVRTVYVKRNQR